MVSPQWHSRRIAVFRNLTINTTCHTVMNFKYLPNKLINIITLVYYYCAWNNTGCPIKTQWHHKSMNHTITRVFFTFVLGRLPLSIRNTILVKKNSQNKVQIMWRSSDDDINGILSQLKIQHGNMITCIEIWPKVKWMLSSFSRRLATILDASVFIHWPSGRISAWSLTSSSSSTAFGHPLLDEASTIK